MTVESENKIEPLKTEPPESGETGEHDVEAIEEAAHADHADDAPERTSPGVSGIDPEATVNLTGVDMDITVNLVGEAGEAPPPSPEPAPVPQGDVARVHLKGLIEALIFVSDKPIKPNEIAKTASAQTKQVKELLEELKAEYAPRGVQLDEVAGGWIFRTNAQFAPFVRDLTKQKPVKLTRAQIETLSILAYRQPITRPEIDDVRGVDCGPVLKLLLERDLIRILGKKDEPGRPLLYGTTGEFLEFFGLKSLKDLPTLREFSDLTEESRRVVERELGETLEGAPGVQIEETATSAPPMGMPGDTLPPGAMEDEEGTSQMTEPPPAMPTGEDVNAEAHAEADAKAETDAEEHDEEEPETDVDSDALPALNADDEAEFPDDDDSEFDDDDDEDDEEDEDEEDDE